MSLHTDLLAQARHLAKKERKKPSQASLRRAVSAAYYALFHLLTSEASQQFVKEEALWKCLNRMYAHGEMLSVSKSFSQGEWPKAFNPVKNVKRIKNDLKLVAQTFIDLQQARHEADYDLSKKFTRKETNTLVDQAEKGIKTWQAIKKDDLSKVYLSCFLLWKQWDKER